MEVKTRLLAAFTAVLSLACAVLPAQPAGAVAVSKNEVGSSFTLTAGPGWYKYGTGTKPVTVPSSAGTQGFVSTQINTAGTVELSRFIPTSSAPSSVPWWNSSWRARQCSTATGAGVQYVDVPFNSLNPAGWAASGWVQANYGDLVPTVWNGSTQATAPFWLATPYDTSDGHAFVQVDFGAGAARTICLNFGHAAGGQVSASNPRLGQNWAGFVQVYKNLDPFNSTTVSVSNLTAVAVQVATNAAGTGAVTIAAGAVANVTVALNGGLWSTGSVSTAGGATGDDSLTSTLTQGTLFISPTNRGVQYWCFAGAAGTSITISPAAAAAVTFTLSATTYCQTVDASSYTKITSSAPISVFSETSAGSDPHSPYPASANALYGVPSASLRLGVSAAGNVSIARSDTATVSTVAVPATGYVLTGLGNVGSAPAFRVTPLSAQTQAAIQQEDSNGSDTTSFLPIEAMSNRYVLPFAANYLAFACPRPGEVLLVGGVSYTCAGAAVGKLLLTGAFPAGTVLEAASGAAFFAYYQRSSAENNLFVPRVNWASVESVPGPVESAYALSGSWTASVSSVSKLWGLISSTAVSAPAGTAVQWQVGCAASTAGPFTYVSVALGDPVPHGCDGLAAVSVKALLSTSNAAVSPSVGSFVVEHSLLVDSALVPSFDLTGAGRVWLWRIHDDGGFHGTDPTALRSPTGTGSGAYQLLLVDNAMGLSPQLQVASGVMSSLGGAPVLLQVSSIAAQVVTAPSATDRVVWRTLTPVWLEREFTVF